MRKSLLFISSILLSVAVFSCNDEEIETLTNSWATTQQTGFGKIILHYVPSEGFSYDDEDGYTTGVTIDLFRDFISFAEEEYDIEIDLELNPIDRFTEFYQIVSDGFDGEFGVANVTITEQRRDEIAFSPYYLKNIAVLITDGSTEEIGVMTEVSEVFSGLTGLAFEGTLHEERIREIERLYLPDLEISFAHSNNEIIERVSSGGAYFSYVDIYNYWRAREQGADLRRHAAGDDPGEMFGIIMPHGSDWQKPINEFFGHNGGYIYSDRYREILEIHLGETLAELLYEAL